MKANLNVQIRKKDATDAFILDYYVVPDGNTLRVYGIHLQATQHPIDKHLTIGRAAEKGPTRDLPLDEKISEYLRTVSRDQGELWCERNNEHTHWFYRNKSPYGTLVGKKELAKDESVELTPGTQLKLGKLTSIMYAVTIAFNIDNSG